MRTAAAWSFPCGGCFLWTGRRVAAPSIRCDSSLIRYVGEYVASVKGISPEEVFRQTAQNARTIYQL